MVGYSFRKGEDMGMKKNKLKRIFQEQSIWFICLSIFILFSILSPDFMRVRNFTNILLQLSVNGVMALGMTIIIINGNIDLSVGSLMSLSAAIVIGFQPYGIFVSVLAGLATGIIMGAINGFFVAKVKVNSFIVTLASMIGIKGLIYIYTEERALIGTNMAFTEFSNSTIGPIPLPAILFMILLIAGEFILRNISHGRNAYAIGGNYDAAVKAGISVKQHIFINYIFSGLCAATAGIIIASKINTASPAIGTMSNLWVIIAVVLGGTNLEGGYGSMIKSFGGILVIAMLNNGLNLLGVQSFYNMLLMGLILITVTYANKRFKPV